MRARTKLLIAFSATFAAFALPSVANAAPSGVTIHNRIGDQFKGFVFSPKPRKCADARTVEVFREKGNGQSPNQDFKVGSTEASRRGRGKYTWYLAPSDPRVGKYYARVPATSACRADNSKTLRISAQPDTRIRKVHHIKRSVVIDYYAVSGVAPYNFQCRLDDQHYRRCPDYQKEYGHLSRGRHVFRVRAIGDNGKRDPTPAKRGFHIPG
jgi:hypothetical protein